MTPFLPFLARVAAALVCLSAVHAAAAPDATDATDASVTMEKYVRTAVVERDGSADIRIETAFRINEPRGIARMAQHLVRYNRSLETLEVTEAYTQKPDGRKVPVGPGGIVDQQEAATGGAPMFQDGRITSIAFPGLEMGDRVMYSLRLKRHTPMYPGQFEDSMLVEPIATLELRLVYDLPDGMELGADAVGFSAAAPLRAGGRTRYQWDFLPGQNRRIENGSVSRSDYGDRLLVSTFGNYAAMAAAYHARASDKAAVTPEISELARQIARKLNGPRAKAFAINDWVRKNIRYVAMYINAGGVVPHEAGAVLANRYGDCKDHTALMEALLAAAGIDSTPALVDASFAYRLPKVPVTFNHVITYIPSLNLYLDSTAAPIGSGFLPSPLLDKDVLLTKTGKLAHTPATQPLQVRSRALVRLAADGSAEFENEVNFGGAFDEMKRVAWRAVSTYDRDRMVSQWLNQNGQRGKGETLLADGDGKSRQFQVIFKGRSENLAALPGPVGLRASSNLSEDIRTNVAALLVEKTRTENFSCFNAEFKEQARYELAKGVKVLAVPKPLAVRTADLDYRADYAERAGAVTVTRSFTLRHPNAQCTPADFAAMHPALDKISRDLKAQIILQVE